MDSIGKPTGIYPLLPRVEVSSPPRMNITPVAGVKYHEALLSRSSFPGLQNRLVTQVPVAWHYSPHSPVVSQLLQQGHLLQQQLWSVQGMAAYAAFASQVFSLNNWLSVGILPESLPFSFWSRPDDGTVLLHNERIKPAFTHQLASYLSKQAGVFQAAAHVLKPYQPVLGLYEDVLHQHIEINNQQILFQGYPFPGSNRASQVYPLDDLLNYSYWLGSPSDYPWTPVRGYVADHPEFWPERSGGFLVPGESWLDRLPAARPEDFTEREALLYSNPLWHSMVKYLGPFGHSVSHEEQEKSYLKEPEKKKSHTHYESEGWESLDDDSVIGGDERLAETVASVPKNAVEQREPAASKSKRMLAKAKHTIAGLQERHKRFKKEKDELLSQREKAIKAEGYQREKHQKLEKHLQELQQQVRHQDAEKEAEMRILQDEILALKQQLGEQVDKPANEQLRLLKKEFKAKEKELASHQKAHSAEREALHRELKNVEQEAGKFKRQRDFAENEKAALVNQQEKGDKTEKDQEQKQKKIQELQETIHDINQNYNRLVSEKEREISRLQKGIKYFERKVKFGDVDKLELKRNLEEKQQTIFNQKGQYKNERQKLHEQIVFLEEKLKQEKKERSDLRQQLNNTKTVGVFSKASGNKGRSRKSFLDKNEGGSLAVENVSELQKKIVAAEDQCWQALRYQKSKFDHFQEEQGVKIDQIKIDANNLSDQMLSHSMMLEKNQKQYCNSLIEDGGRSLEDFICQYKGKQKTQRNNFSRLHGKIEYVISGVNQTKDIGRLVKAYEELSDLNKEILAINFIERFDSVSAFEKLRKAKHLVFNQDIQRNQHEKPQDISEDRPLESAVSILRQGGGTKREKLQSLFDSPIGFILAGRGDLELRNKKKYNKKQSFMGGLLEGVIGQRNAVSHEIKLDAHFIHEFIKEYKEAIKQESKLNIEKHQGAHRLKKERRLKAILQIEKFINAQDKSHPDYQQHCQLACQALMRIREPGFVWQKDIPRCGGFAVLQHAWREKPDVVTRILLDFHVNNKAKVTALGGKEVEIKSASADLLRQPKGALADRIIVDSFYKSEKSGSNPVEDSYIGYFLEVMPLIYRGENEAYNANASQNLLELLQKNVINGGAVGLCINKAFSRKLDESMVDGRARKSAANEFETLKLSEPVGDVNVGHHVIIDGFRFDESNVYIKVHSWGKVCRYCIDRQDFLRHILTDTVLIYPGEFNSDLDGVRAPEPEIIFARENGEKEYIDCYGYRKKIIPNVLYKSEVTGSAYYDGNGKNYWMDKNESRDLFWISGGMDVVAWKKDKAELEQVGKTFFGHKFVVVNNTGQVRYLIVGENVQGFSNKKYMLKQNGEILITTINTF